MTERERLIKLLLSSEPIHERDLDDDWIDGEIAAIADYLLKNGVCLPLVNENDTVYIILLNKVIPFDIIYVNLYQKQFFFKGQHGLCLSYTFKTDDIGKTVFLTPEDAEKALDEITKGTAQNGLAYATTDETENFELAMG